MLTTTAIQRALRHAASHGDSGPHYRDGRNDPPRSVAITTPSIAAGDVVRKWDEERGIFVYETKLA